MKSTLLKKLEGDDIFISYSRSDGAAYLTGLDAALSRKGFACFTDKRGTDAGRFPPKTLYRKIRNCNTLVLLASPRAQMRPENITPELREFIEENGTSRIICVSFDRDVEPLPDFPEEWHDYIVGKARECEDPARLKTRGDDCRSSLARSPTSRRQSCACAPRTWTAASNTPWTR